MSETQPRDVLPQGAAAWNAWRASQDVDRFELDELTLPAPGQESPVDDPFDFWLSEADLRSCSLRHAEMTDGCLRDVLFDGSDLTGARFVGCDLRRSSFRNAGLADATFDGCDFAGVDLTGAVMDGTTFVGIDLASVVGLAAINHRSPSVIDQRTMDRTVATLQTLAVWNPDVLAFFTAAGLAAADVERLAARLDPG